MRSHIYLILIVVAAVLAGTAAASRAQPPTVPKLTDRALDRASYVELAKQWKQYIEDNGESPAALVNLATAYYYSDQKEAAMIAARRAAEIRPDNPDALAYLAKLLAMYEDDNEEAIRLLEKCVAIQPDHELGLINLATIYLKRGEFEKSDKIFKTIFDQRIVERPLQDFAYNMLVGLPQGAVLITNGDNDTFPPLALQAGMDFRKDVAVINRHLLRIDAYVDAVFKRYPAIKPRGAVRADEPAEEVVELLKMMVDDDDITVHFALSVNLNDLGFSPDLVPEGLTQRSSKKGLTADEAADLFLETYRLDSATDWNYAWDLKTSISHLLSNYVISVLHIAKDGSMSRENRTKLLDKAMEIAEFHDMERLAIIVNSMQKREK
jgi:tetratricopeptide (TPR) repeat protein